MLNDQKKGPKRAGWRENTLLAVAVVIFCATALWVVASPVELLPTPEQLFAKVGAGLIAFFILCGAVALRPDDDPFKSLFTDRLRPKWMK